MTIRDEKMVSEKAQNESKDAEKKVARKKVFTYTDKTPAEIEQRRKDLEAQIKRLGGHLEKHKSVEQLTPRKNGKNNASERRFDSESSSEDEALKSKRVKRESPKGSSKRGATKMRIDRNNNMQNENEKVTVETIESFPDILDNFDRAF